MKHVCTHIDRLVYISLTLAVAGSLSIVYASSFGQKSGCGEVPLATYRVKEVNRSKSCLCKEVSITVLESVELGYLSKQEAENIERKCWDLPADVF